MENWLVALIAAAGAVGGSAVTGVIAYRLARLEREALDKGELRTSLAAYGAALDRLSLQVDRLPQAHGIEEGWTTRLVALWPTLDWLMGRLSVATIGRGAMQAVDEVIAATNRLMLVAPQPVMETMQIISELIGRFEPAGAGWRGEWQDARAAFARASRESVVAHRKDRLSRSRVPKHVPDSTELSRTGLISMEASGRDRTQMAPQRQFSVRKPGFESP
ncbi:MAG TPA: hypothetical protein VF085_10585 [Solirubrobacterales bacterium]